MLIECMRIVTIHLDLREERKCDTMIELTNLLYCLIGFRFLSEELIAGESENYEVVMRIGIPEFLESFELGSESTLGRGIHDEKDFSSIGFESDRFMIGFLDLDIVE